MEQLALLQGVAMGLKVEPMTPAQQQDLRAVGRKAVQRAFDQPSRLFSLTVPRPRFLSIDPAEQAAQQERFGVWPPQSKE